MKYYASTQDELGLRIPPVGFLLARGLPGMLE